MAILYYILLIPAWVVAAVREARSQRVALRGPAAAPEATDDAATRAYRLQPV